eukprot:110690_1
MFGGDKTREFQQGMDQQSLRRGREEERLNLRRKRREEQLQRKRRQIMSNPLQQNNSNTQFDSININSCSSRLASTTGINTATITLHNLSTYISQIKSSDCLAQMHGTMSIRILLSSPKVEPPYGSIMSADIVPLLLSFFKHDKNEKLQFEAAWAVTNLCSATTEVCNFVCQHNAIRAFEHLLTTTKHFEIMEQAVWGLGNIAGESQSLRNMILKDGIFEFLLERAEQFLQSKHYTLCRNAVWCLSNLIRYDGVAIDNDDKKQPINDLCPWRELKNMIPIFNRLLKEIGDKIQAIKIEINGGSLQQTNAEYNELLQCCSDCLWTIHNSQIYAELSPQSSYISDVFSCDLVDRIIVFMSMDSVILLAPSLRIIGTFVCGEDYVTQLVLQKGYFEAAMLNLHCKVRLIRKEVCWTLSNIAGCEKEIAAQMLTYSEGQLLESIVATCLYDDDQVKKEAGWVLANLVSLSDPDIIECLVAKGVIGALRAVMKTSSVKKPLITCMEAFDIIMSHSQSRDGGPKDYVSKVEESGCCEIFDILQAGVDDEDKVFVTSYELCTKYWPEDDVSAW